MNSYHSPLPPELQRWYIYTPDGGHSIQVILKEQVSEAFLTHSAKDKMVAAPVRAVLRVGYEIQRGYVICNLPYDSELGLMVETDDDEY